MLLQSSADWTDLTLTGTALVVLMSVAGNSLAAHVLQKMPHETFVRYSVYLLTGMGGWFLVKAVMLFIDAS